MEGYELPVQIENQPSYLHTTPNFNELRQPVDASFKTASLPEIHKLVSRIRSLYLRFAYERIWSILVHLTYNNFTSVTLRSRCSLGDQKADGQAHLTSHEETRIKTALVGSVESRRKFKEILNHGPLWKELVLCSDCGILLLVKQSFLPVIKEFGPRIVEQYISSVGNTEEYRSLVCNILSDFSPAHRLSISYYTNAHKELGNIITTRSSTSSPLAQAPTLSSPDRICGDADPQIPKTGGEVATGNRRSVSVVPDRSNNDPIPNELSTKDITLRSRIRTTQSSNKYRQAKDKGREAARIKSTSSTTLKKRPPSRVSQPSWALVSQDQWRTPEEQTLFEFFRNSICAHRTVFTDPDSNTYTGIIPERCQGVKSMKHCLSSNYVKVCVPSQLEKFATLELRYYGQVMRFLQKNVGKPDMSESILKIVWLLVHHQVVSEDRDANRKWSMHSKVLGILQSKGININSKWALFPTYESVLKLTRPRDEKVYDENDEAKVKQKSNDGIDVTYLVQCDDPTLICDIGCSRELLMLMGLVNVAEDKTRGHWDARVTAGRELASRISAVEQWTKEPIKENWEVAMQIARSYQITAQINVMVRLLGNTKASPLLQDLADGLALLILGLPDGSELFKKHLYTMQHPLQPHFWAIILSSRYGRTCFLKLKGICDRSKRTNTSRPLSVAEQLLEWQERNPPTDFIKHGWFEEMLEGNELEDLSLG